MNATRSKVFSLNREFVNFIRNIIENWIPPALRDSVLFYPLLYLVFGSRTSYYAKFREKTPYLSLEEYAAYYKNFPHVMGETDLNRVCIEEILKNIIGSKVLDAGCGRGFLAKTIKKKYPDKQVTGVDIETSQATQSVCDVAFESAFVENLPYADKSFDTVVCTHTLEHVLSFEKALNELRRVVKKRLIIVVPCEREYKYSFNLHVNFFPYKHSFLKQVQASQFQHRCEILDGDIYYEENVT